MNKYLRFLRKINLKTIYFNLKYLPLKDAIKLPILISHRVFLLKTKGTIKIESPIHRGMINIGYGEVGIFDMKHSRSVWEVSGEIIFKGRANIGHGSKISVGKNGILELGENFRITAESAIASHKHIKFGADCLISWDCLIMDTDFHKIIQDGHIINSPEPVIIGQKVWIGCRNLILKGAIIADNSIIGANSMVSKDISNKSGLFVGNPIKHYKENVRWEP
jgi:acetyltransferase-like isoleucine patch superfamily enzyme